MTNTPPTIADIYTLLKEQQAERTTETHAIKADLHHIQTQLFDPEHGLVVKVNAIGRKQDDVIKQVNVVSSLKQQVNVLSRWKSNVQKVGWIIVTAVIGFLFKFNTDK